MSEMGVSVIMATYNGVRYLTEQLDTICPYLTAGDELIICDDCSKDSTVELLRKYVEINNLGDIVHIYVNECNLGFQNNFQKALKLAKNKYIFFADQDDLWDAEKIPQMVAFMEEHSDCNVLCCDYDPFMATDNAPKPPKKILKQMPNNGVVEHKRLLPRSIYIGQLGCCMCMRKEFRDSIESYWFEAWAQDDRSWRLALCSNGLYVMHRNYVKHRLHDNNTSTYGKYHSVEKRVKLFQSMLQADEQMIRYMECNCSQDRKGILLLNKNKKMMKLRIDLIQNRRLRNCFLLLRYLRYYQAKKSYLVELKMLVKRA